MTIAVLVGGLAMLASADLAAAQDVAGAPRQAAAPPATLPVAIPRLAPPPPAAAPSRPSARTIAGQGMATPPDPAKMQAARVAVANGWARYDPDASGQLSPLEFGTWVLAATGQDMTAEVERTRTERVDKLAAVKVLNATAAAFAKADADKSRGISRQELTLFLSA